ncbi:MAG: NUDIX hydrolase [Planctomycetota bacterium]
MQLIGEGKYLRILKKGRWEFVERVNASSVVAMVAVTRENEIILVEQYRPPVRKRVLELPAGLVGDVDGDHDQRRAARRELIEETGFRAHRVEPIVEIPSSAGLTTETTVLYRCTGLRRVGEGGGDETENIKVHLLPLDKAAAWLARRVKRGALVDAKVYAGLYYAGVDAQGNSVPIAP